MFIREFSIDRFGMLHNQHVSALSPGITIILGENEAGKSTCLNFFRAMLFGYARQRRSIDYMQDGKSVSGGGLLIESEAFGPVRLSRRPGPHGGPFMLTALDGTPRPDADLAVLLRGCTPDLYDKVFAFSLEELIHFGSLTDDSIRHALHGAAFGLGLRSPGQVLKEIDEEMKRIFAPRASSSKIHRLLQDFDTVDATIRERGNEVDEYSARRAELEAAAQELEGLKAALLVLENERRMLERTIALRRRWEALRDAEDSLSAVPEPTGEFTPDGRERLERFLERQEDRNRTLSTSRRSLERAGEDLASLVFEPAFADAAMSLFSLAERKESVREAVSQLRLLDAERESLERDIDGICADLGTGWNAERVRDSDLSLAVHEQGRTMGQRLGAAEQTLHAMQSDCKRLDHERGVAEQAFAEVEAALRGAGGLEAGGESDFAPVDEPAMEQLSQLLVRAGDAREKTGALALAVRNAELSLDQAIAAIDVKWFRQELGGAAITLLDRERLLGLSRSVVAFAPLLADRDREKKSAQLLYDDATVRVNAMEVSVSSQAASLLGVDTLGGAVSVAEAGAALDLRRRIVRRAQAARKNLEAAQTAYATTNEQLGDIASLVHGTRKKSTFPWSTVVLFFAATFLICGAGVLYFGVSGGNELTFRVGTASLAAGGALALAWLALFARGGDDMLGETMENNWVTIEKRLVRTRMAAQTARHEAEEALGAVVGDAPDLFPDGLIDIESIAEVEQELASQRERLIVLEREGKELERERVAFALAQKRLDDAEKAWESALSEQTSALATWVGALQSLGLPETSPPEDARFLLERLDTALARQSNVQGKIAEQEAARAQISECLRFARSIPALAGFLASLPEPDSHLAPEHGPWLEMVGDFLSRWRSAGRERIRLSELCTMRSSRLEEATASHSHARVELEKAVVLLTEAEKGWCAWLETMGLALGMSPETARIALDAVGKAKSALEQMRRIDARIAAIRRDTASFLRELAGYAPFLPEHPAGSLLADPETKPAVPDTAGMALILSLLDELAEKARRAGELAAIRKDREGELPGLHDAVALAAEHVASTREELGEMFRLAGCADPEEFRRAHAIWERREALLTSQRALRAAFEREAGEVGLAPERVIDSFRGVGPEEAAALLVEQELKLGEALSRKETLAERKGALDAAMVGLLNEKGLMLLFARRESLVGELSSLAREWSRFALAKEFLLVAKRRFESERQTGVVKAAGDIFSAITEGAYTGITVSLDDESIGAVTRGGHVRNPKTELSRGTREQLYLALRLAYVVDHGAQAGKLPVVMDDILVNFDERRARNTAAALAVFAQKHQVLFFTCHESMAALLAKASPGAVRYELASGVFRACP